MEWTFGSLRTGLSSSYQEGKSFLTPEAGANFERQKFTSTKNIMQGTLALKYNEWIMFKEFYIDRKQGELSFTYPDCDLGDRTASFYGNPKVTEGQGFWIVSLGLILEPTKYKTNVVLSYNDNLATYNDNLADLEVVYEL